MAWTALRKLAVLISAAAVLAACGGSSTASSTSDATDLAFAGGVGYNGSAVRISGGDATTSVSATAVTVSFTQSNRTLSVKVPVTNFQSGDSFTVGTTDGATVTYTETPTSGSKLAWVANSGTVSISSSGSTSTLTANLSGLSFTADSTVTDNGAAGTLFIEGQLAGIDLSASGGVGGATTLTFSNNADSNANLSNLTDPVVAYATSGLIGTLTTTSGSGTSLRNVTVILYGSAKTGTTVTLTGLITGFATVSYTEGDGSSSKTWVAKSGTLKVRSRTDTTAKVELVNAVFENPQVDSSNTATGNFTLNGSITRN